MENFRRIVCRTDEIISPDSRLITLLLVIISFEKSTFNCQQPEALHLEKCMLSSFSLTEITRIKHVRREDRNAYFGKHFRFPGIPRSVHSPASFASNPSIFPLKFACHITRHVTGRFYDALYDESQNLYSVRGLYRLTPFSRKKNGQATISAAPSRKFSSLSPRVISTQPTISELRKMLRVRISPRVAISRPEKRIGFSRRFRTRWKKKERFDERN